MNEQSGSIVGIATRLALAIAMLLPAAAADLDRDGLDDALEQQLLERFVPSFRIDPKDCDVKPAQFRAGAADPEVAARDGTLYGQATPNGVAKRGTPNGSAIELHFYHLWSRDCGKRAHPLDAEHVSGLVEQDAAGSWRAIAWYAAAHENTPCDFSSLAKAADVLAETAGPVVWVSRGKHASFLHLKGCQLGCGGDVCRRDFVPMAPAAIVNLGERDVPMNGAAWMLSARWPLAAKLRLDFTPERMAVLEKPGPLGIITLSPRLRPAQAFMLGGDSTGDALSVTGKKTAESLDATGQAIGTSVAQTGQALAASTRKTARALRAATGATGRFLRGRRDRTKAQLQP